MDEQTAIDRITEVENLTDNLEDDDANWLINWGINKAKVLLPSIKDDDVAGEKLDALMAVMRKLNEIVPDLANMKPGTFADNVAELAKLYTEAFGTAKTLVARQTIEAVKQKSPREAIDYLLGLVAPADDKAAVQPAPVKKVTKKSKDK